MPKAVKATAVRCSELSAVVAWEANPQIQREDISEPRECPLETGFRIGTRDSRLAMSEVTRNVSLSIWSDPIYRRPKGEDRGL